MLLSYRRMHTAIRLLGDEKNYTNKYCTPDQGSATLAPAWYYQSAGSRFQEQTTDRPSPWPDRWRTKLGSQQKKPAATGLLCTGHSYINIPSCLLVLSAVVEPLLLYRSIETLCQLESYRSLLITIRSKLVHRELTVQPLSSFDHGTATPL